MTLPDNLVRDLSQIIQNCENEVAKIEEQLAKTGKHDGDATEIPNVLDSSANEKDLDRVAVQTTAQPSEYFGNELLSDLDFSVNDATLDHVAIAPITEPPKFLNREIINTGHEQSQRNPTTLKDFKNEPPKPNSIPGVEDWPFVLSFPRLVHDATPAVVHVDLPDMISTALNQARKRYSSSQLYVLKGKALKFQQKCATTATTIKDVVELLTWGFKVNFHHGFECLRVAVEGGCITTIAILLRAGATVTPQTKLQKEGPSLLLTLVKKVAPNNGCQHLQRISLLLIRAGAEPSTLTLVTGK
ncbi:hypothetical protein B0J14DRAFT_645049 [Halenospora varia]|nr:hypothetical protein B0J14DRAFT_645049 [Halenospora varia]